MSKLDIVEFSRWTIENSAFVGADLDGGDVQEKAIACGLLVQTKYDPAIHGRAETSEYVEPGDQWLVFSDEFRTMASKGPVK